ncbi:MAG: hypothetical protein PHW87_06490 [Methanothrix sp.]|nr:hypothetical protein [Methanothrix sp.]
MIGCVDMPVTFEPHKRLEHLEDYVSKIDLFLPAEEARIQLLRCRLVGYGLVAEINEEAYTRKYIDQLFAQAYQTLSTATGRDVADPYKDPCKSQYMILDELRSYASKDPALPFMRFIRAEFKKVFVTTLRLMTDLCPSEKKYSWEEVKVQLQEIMMSLNVDVTWEECEERLERYLKKIAPVMKI